MTSCPPLFIRHSTERESCRREDLINGLRRRGEELVGLLSKNKSSDGVSGSQDTQMRMMERGEQIAETEQTAGLDNDNILQLQRTIMQGARVCATHQNASQFPHSPALLPLLSLIAMNTCVTPRRPRRGPR